MSKYTIKTLSLKITRLPNSNKYRDEKSLKLKLNNVNSYHCKHPKASLHNSMHDKCFNSAYVISPVMPVHENNVIQ